MNVELRALGADFQAKLRTIDALGQPLREPWIDLRQRTPRADPPRGSPAAAPVTDAAQRSLPWPSWRRSRATSTRCSPAIGVAAGVPRQAACAAPARGERGRRGSRPGDTPSRAGARRATRIGARRPRRSRLGMRARMRAHVCARVCTSLGCVCVDRRCVACGA